MDYQATFDTAFIGDTFTIEHQSEKEVSIKYETSDENILEKYLKDLLG